MNNTLIIALVVAVVGPVILSWLSGKQRAREQARREEREDEVAAKAVEVAATAKAQRDEVAERLRKATEQADQRQAEAVLAAEGVAKLLLEAQKKTTLGTDEVARLAGADTGISRGSMIAITLSFPNENREDVLLAEVPRVGESIRLRNGANEPWLLVKNVVWVEGSQPPHVIISVEPHEEVLRHLNAREGGDRD